MPTSRRTDRRDAYRSRVAAEDGAGSRSLTRRREARPSARVGEPTTLRGKSRSRRTTFNSAAYQSDLGTQIHPGEQDDHGRERAVDLARVPELTVHVLAMAPIRITRSPPWRGRGRIWARTPHRRRGTMGCNSARRGVLAQPLRCLWRAPRRLEVDPNAHGLPRWARSETDVRGLQGTRMYKRTTDPVANERICTRSHTWFASHSP